MSAAELSPIATPMQIGTVRLNVQDLDKLSAYYQDLLGLKILSSTGNTVQLGAGTTPLLELTGDRGFTRHDPHHAGLFHTAFLMPTRTDLARWLRFVATNRTPIVGASDHAVSEAIYLTDPEGNGIEVYADRPVAAWPTSGKSIDMPSNQLDVQSLFAADNGQPWKAAPAGLIVGHLHLQAGRLTSAEAFYAGILGFDVTCRYTGGVFYGAGGYHHQLATNMWNSRGAGPVAPGTTGLAGFDLLIDTPEHLATLRTKTAGLPITETPTGFITSDPSATPINFKTK